MELRKVLYCGPVPDKRDYFGGIAYIYHSYSESADLFAQNNIQMIFQNSLIDRHGDSVGVGNRKALLKTLFSGSYIAERAERENANIVHLNTSRGVTLFKDLLVASCIKRRTNAKVILSIHFAEVDKIIQRDLLGLLSKRLFECVDEIIFLSRETLESFTLKHIASNAQKKVLYTFFSDQFGDSAKVDSCDAKTILFMGSLDRRKGITDLIDTILPFKDEYKLIVCGTGDSEIEKRIASLSAQYPHNFEYRGYVRGAKKREAFLDSDVFCLPSYGEGLPIAMLEAMSYGLVPVVSSVGAIPEIIKSHDNGFLVSPGNHEELKRSIDLAFGHVCEVGERAKESVTDLRLARNIRDLCSIYKDLG